MDNLQNFNTQLTSHYEKNKKHLINKVYPYLRSYDVAEEVVQDAFVKALSNASAWDEKKGTVKTWFNKILFSTLWNYKRKLKKEHIFFSHDNEADVALGEANSVSEVLNVLSNNMHKNVLLLKYEYGYSYEEVAETVGVSVHNVKKIHQRFKNNFVLEE